MEIELLFVKTVKSLTSGEHRGRSEGTGFDFVGLRDWQSGDRFSSIDWAQSSITNFSPLMVREFDQPAAANVVVVADHSSSTRCAINGQSIEAVHAHAIATIGLSAVFFQDSFGLITFRSRDGLAVDEFEAVSPRIGKGHVVRCLQAYEYGTGLESLRRADRLSDTLAGFMRSTTLIPFVSDFLFPHPHNVLEELSRLNAVHDVFVVLIDAAFAFALPRVGSGWLRVADVETGAQRVISRGDLVRLHRNVVEWQDEVERAARDLDLDVVRLGPDSTQSDLALAEFVVARRLRKAS